MIKMTELNLGLAIITLNGPNTILKADVDRLNKHMNKTHIKKHDML